MVGPRSLSTEQDVCEAIFRSSGPSWPAPGISLSITNCGIGTSPAKTANDGTIAQHPPMSRNLDDDLLGQPLGLTCARHSSVWMRTVSPISRKRRKGAQAATRGGYAPALPIA